MQLELNRAFKSIMAKKGISGVQVAKKLGVSSSTISNNIGKNSNPSLSTLQRYADCLGVNVSEVFLVAEQIKREGE